MAPFGKGSCRPKATEGLFKRAKRPTELYYCFSLTLGQQYNPSTAERGPPPFPKGRQVYRLPQRGRHVTKIPATIKHSAANFFFVIFS